jgi:hypothetical protein
VSSHQQAVTEFIGEDDLNTTHKNENFENDFRFSRPIQIKFLKSSDIDCLK